LNVADTADGAVPLVALKVSHALPCAVAAVHARVPGLLLEMFAVTVLNAVLPTAAESRRTAGDTEGTPTFGGLTSSSSWQVETIREDTTTKTPAVTRALSGRRLGRFGPTPGSKNPPP
jgi:hypothetical protein